MIEVLLLAVGLAMDAAAAAAGLGASHRSIRPVVVGSLLFGVFQSGMAAMGRIGGLAITSVVSAWDHWVAFVVLVGIGVHTLWEARSDGDVEAGRETRSLLGLVALALATSIDALAAGVTLPVLEVGPVFAIAAIGAVTWGLSLAAGLVGRRLGDRFGARLEVVGGLALVGIGVKVLVEHTWF